MGILADVFVATEYDAKQYANPDTHSDPALRKRITLAEFKSLTSLEFTTLWAILENVDWDVEHHELIDESNEGDDESWLFRFPEQLVDLLAAMNETTLIDANSLWAATDEIDCDPSEMLPVTQQLQALAIKARASGCKMYLWGCL
jgi:hypothetical protein